MKNLSEMCKPCQEHSELHIPDSRFWRFSFGFIHQLSLHKRFGHLCLKLSSIIAVTFCRHLFAFNPKPGRVSNANRIFSHLDKFQQKLKFSYSVILNPSVPAEGNLRIRVRYLSWIWLKIPLKLHLLSKFTIFDVESGFRGIEKS